MLPASIFALLALQSPAATKELLPAPTGPYPTGRMSFHWKDTRPELETKTPRDRRELMVHVFYPADVAGSAQRAVYMPDAEVMRGSINEQLMASVTSLRAYSRENAPVAKGTTRFPVLILLPGGGMKGLTYHTLLEDLASHGYVVAAIDPPYNARGVRFPDGRVLGNLPPGELGWPQSQNQQQELKNYKERIVHWSGDVSFVINRLAALDRGRSAFSGRLDLARGVGVVGHSRGGQAAGTVRMLDPRVKSGINLDGTQGPYMFQPVKGEEVSGEQPFLWIQKTLPEPPSEQQLLRARRTRAQYDSVLGLMVGTWHKKLGGIKGGAMLVYFNQPNIEHIDFSDESLWHTTLSPEARAVKLRTIANTRAWVRAWFDGTIRGNWNDLRRLFGEAGKTEPQTTAMLFGKVWP